MTSSAGGFKQSRANLTRTLWRWHFYAGVLSAPIVMLLGVTGAIYLFKPIAEPIMYRHLQTVQTVESARRPAELIAAAESDKDRGRAFAITPPASTTQAAEVTVRDAARRTWLVYVDPSDGRVLGSLEKSRMVMQRVRKLHGELLLGTVGTMIVELAASWMFVLLASGVGLVWMSASHPVLGVWIPRRTLRGRALRGRTLIRELHTVTGMWATAGLLVLLVTGMPWTTVFGSLFKSGLSNAGQWRPAEAEFRVELQSTPPRGQTSPLSIDAVFALAKTHQMPTGYTLLLPQGPTGTYGLVARNQPLHKQRFVYLDQYTGEVLGQAGGDDFPLAASWVSNGIRLHQGELFGWPNLVLMLLIALAAVGLSVTGLLMWWRRRPAGAFAAPPRYDSQAIPRGWLIGVVLLAVCLPLLAASLVVIILIDRIVASRFPAGTGATSDRNPPGVTN